MSGGAPVRGEGNGGVRLPEAEMPMEITFAVKDPKKGWVIPKFPERELDKINKDVFDKAVKGQPVFGKHGPATFYVTAGKVFKGRAVKPLTEEDYDKKALKDIAKEGQKSAKVYGAARATWNFLKKIPALIGKVGALIMWWSGTASAIQVQAKSVRGYFNEENTKCQDLLEQIQEVNGILKDKKTTHEKLGITEEKFNALKDKMERLTKASREWVGIIDEVSILFFSGGYDKTQAGPQAGMDCYVNAINNDKYQSFAVAILNILEFRALLANEFELDLVPLVKNQETLFINTLKASRSEDAKPNQAWENAYEYAQHTARTFNKIYHFKKRIDDNLRIENQLLIELDVVDFFGNQSDRYSGLFRKILKEQGFTNIEITAYLAAYAKAYKVVEEMHRNLQEINELVHQQRYEDAMELYKEVLEKNYQAYREGLQDLILLQRLQYSKGLEVDPFDIAVYRFVKALRNNGVEDQDLPSYPREFSVHDYFTKHGERFAGAVQVCLSIGLNLEENFKESTLEITEEEKQSMNSFLAPHLDRFDQNVSVRTHMMTLTGVDASVRSQWGQKIRSLRRLGWKSKDITKNFQKLFNDYGRISARLYTAYLAVEQNPDNLILRRQFQDVWKASEKEIKKVRKELEKFGGVEKVGKFSDVYNEFATSFSKEERAQLPNTFQDYGKLLLERHDFLNQLEQDFKIAKHPLTDGLLRFPRFKDVRWGEILKAHGWSAAGIKNFEKTYVEYIRLVDELRYYEYLNATHPAAYNRFQLKRLAEKRLKKVQELERRLETQFGGARGVYDLKAAIEEMQHNLQYDQENTSDRFMKRQCQRSIELLDRAVQFSSSLTADRVFVKGFYRKLNLTEGLVKGSIENLLSVSGWQRKMDDFDWTHSLEKPTSVFGKMKRALGGKESDTEALDRIYKSYLDHLDRIVSLEQLYSATKHPKVRADLETSFKKGYKELLKLQDELSPLILKLSAMQRDKRVHLNAYKATLEVDLSKREAILKEMEEERSTISPEKWKKIEGLYLKNREAVKEAKRELQQIDREIARLDDANFAQEFAQNVALVDQLACMFNLQQDIATWRLKDNPYLTTNESGISIWLHANGWTIENTNDFNAILNTYMSLVQKMHPLYEKIKTGRANNAEKKRYLELQWDHVAVQSEFEILGVMAKLTELEAACYDRQEDLNGRLLNLDLTVEECEEIEKQIAYYGQLASFVEITANLVAEGERVGSIDIRPVEEQP